MNILGIHCNTKWEDEEEEGFSFHDSAAALLRDGAMVAAVEEERLSRLKHSNTFPVHSIQRCLLEAGISLAQVDCIAINRGEQLFNDSVLHDWLSNNAANACSGRTVLGDCFRRAFGVDVADRVFFFSPHHIAHAWSTYVPSGFDDSLVYVADGDGDNLSGLMLVAEGNKLTTVREFPLAQSLGDLYVNIIKLIGYNRFDEYKAMGLAPYGNPAVFEEAFASCYQLHSDGEYEVAQLPTWAANLGHLGLVQRARRKNAPFTQEHKDIAAALQSMLERIVLHVLSHFRTATGKRNLCLAGGVFHNCSLNGSILYSRLFERVFVQPAAHDAGGAYGAAIHAAVQFGEPLGEPAWRHVYFGPDLHRGDQLRSQVKRWSAFVEAEDIGDSFDRPARLLAGGAVIGWVQGRSEFGPRALGNRSILADPRPPGNKDRINGLVKKREGFRPFAPAILAERVREYVELPDNQAEFPFMLFVLKIREEHRVKLGAVTHVDGTARLQTVCRNTNQPFWDLIHAFEEQTGLPVLLNTSFNNNAEPIVDSPDDAIGCYLTTGLDALVIGDCLLWKKSPEISDVALGALIPQLPSYRQLVKRRRFGQVTGKLETIYSAHATRNRLFCTPDITISEPAYQILQLADGVRPIDDLMRSAGTGNAASGLWSELRRLWVERIVVLSPTP